VGRARLWRGERDFERGGYVQEGFFDSCGEPPLPPQASSYVRLTRYSGRVRRTKRETAMPEIYVHAVKGRSLDQKRALIKDITDAVVKNFSVPAEAVMVEIVESEPTAKAKGGVLFSEMRR
jgi:4-oxalocrotonate tautomerase